MEFRNRAPSIYRDSRADDNYREYGWSNPASGNFLRGECSVGRRRNRLQDSSGCFSLRHRLFAVGLAYSRDAALPWADLDRGSNWGPKPPSIGICERLTCSSTASVTTVGNRWFSHQYNHGHSLLYRHAVLLCLESAFSSKDGKCSCCGIDSGFVSLQFRFSQLGKVGSRRRSACVRKIYCGKLLVPVVGDHRPGALSPLDPGISAVRILAGASANRLLLAESAVAQARSRSGAKSKTGDGTA